MTGDHAPIRTIPRPNCIMCGLAGEVFHDALQDRLFGVPGKWTLKKCPDVECGFVWLDPAPRSDDIWKTYATYYTHQDSRQTAANPLKRGYHFIRDCYLSLRYGYFPGQNRSRLACLGSIFYFLPGRRSDEDFGVMYLSYKPGGRLLEVGCGSGLMLDNMISMGWRAEGLDIDPAAVANAREKGLSVSLGTLDEQCYGDNTFDAVIMSHIIEHVQDPESLLRECRRILKPGGVLSLVTPNTESAGSRYFGPSWLHLDPPRHLTLFNVATIQKLAQRTGFREVGIRTTIRDAHTLFWASHIIKRHGTYVMGAKPGFAMKSVMTLLRLLEWLFLKFSPRGGEEISLKGIK